MWYWQGDNDGIIKYLSPKPEEVPIIHFLSRIWQISEGKNSWKIRLDLPLTWIEFRNTTNQFCLLTWYDCYMLLDIILLVCKLQTYNHRMWLNLKVVMVLLQESSSFANKYRNSDERQTNNYKIVQMLKPVVQFNFLNTVIRCIWHLTCYEFKCFWKVARNLAGLDQVQRENGIRKKNTKGKYWSGIELI